MIPVQIYNTCTSYYSNKYFALGAKTKNEIKQNVPNDHKDGRIFFRSFIRRQGLFNVKDVKANQKQKA